MLDVTNPVLLTFVLYGLVLVGLGLVAYRRTSDLADYILGGRRLGSWVSAFSAQASDMSGWLLMGLPGLAYSRGGVALWMALGLATGTYLNWTLVAGRLREATFREDDALTVPVYLERRFDDGTHLLRGLSALVILVFFTFYTGSGLVAGARLFETVFEVKYATAVTAGGVTILLYTLIGGFLAVSWTDVLQGLLMVIALVVVAGLGLFLVGGPAELRGGPGTATPNYLSPLWDADGRAIGWVTVLSMTGWGLGYFGQPHILARFMAIESRDRVPRARRIAVTWVVVCLGASVVCGILAVPLLETSLTGPETEKAFIYLAEWMLHPLVAGVVLAAVLAAIMSTADSQLLVASSAVAEDFYAGFFGSSSSRARLWVGRLAVVGISLAAYAIALDPESMVLELVAYAWAGFGATFGPVLLLALYWRRMNRSGALAGILVGAATVFVWARLSGGWFDLYELVPGFGFGLVAAVVGSLLDQRDGDVK